MGAMWSANQPHSSGNIDLFKGMGCGGNINIIKLMQIIDDQYTAFRLSLLFIL